MEALLPLALLACPIGMGAMMWFMMRGGRKGEAAGSGGSLPDLKAEQARLAQKIAALEQDRTGAAEPAPLAATAGALERQAATPAHAR